MALTQTAQAAKTNGSSARPTWSAESRARLSASMKALRAKQRAEKGLPPKPKPGTLTPFAKEKAARKAKILKLKAQGLHESEIARRMKLHVASIYYHTAEARGVRPPYTKVADRSHNTTRKESGPVPEQMVWLRQASQEAHAAAKTRELTVAECYAIIAYKKAFAGA